MASSSNEVLLGDKHNEDETDFPKFPVPLARARHYTVNRVKDGLRYADYALGHLTRKLTPISQQAMLIYKESAESFLQLVAQRPEDMTDEEYEDFKLKHLAQIRDFEVDMQHQDGMRISASEEAQDLQDRLIDLKTMQYYARYGDIFASVRKHVKVTAPRCELEGWQLLHRNYWIEINAKLRMESEAWKLIKITRKTEACPTSIAVHHTCARIGVDPDEVIVAIGQYAELHRIPHSDLEELVRDGRWAILAKQLDYDRTKLHAVFPSSATVYLAIIGPIIDVLIDVLFVKCPLRPNDAHLWKPSKYAREQSEKLLKSTAEKGMIEEKAVKDVLRKLCDEQKVQAY